MVKCIVHVTQAGIWPRRSPCPQLHTIQVLHPWSLQDDHRHEEILPWLHQDKQEKLHCLQGQCS